MGGSHSHPASNASSPRQRRGGTRTPEKPRVTTGKPVVVPTRYASVATMNNRVSDKSDDRCNKNRSSSAKQANFYSAADMTAMAPFYGLVPMNMYPLNHHHIPHLQSGQQQYNQQTWTPVDQWQNAYCYSAVAGANYSPYPMTTVKNAHITSKNPHTATQTTQIAHRRRSLGAQVPLCQNENHYMSTLTPNTTSYEHSQTMAHSNKDVHLSNSKPYNYNDFYEDYKKQKQHQQQPPQPTSGGSLKRTKSASAAAIAQQATYEAMRTIDMYLVRQMARNLLDFDLESRIDEELGRRERATARLASGTLHDEIELLNIEKLLLTSDERMNAFAVQLLRQRQAAATTANSSLNTSLPSPSVTSKHAHSGHNNHSSCSPGLSTSTNSKGRVCLSDIRIPLMWREEDHFKNRGSYKRYAVFCIVRCGSYIYDTPLIANVDRTCTDVTFDSENHLDVTFDNVGPDFKLHVHVFACAYAHEQSLLKSTLHAPTTRLRRKISASLSRAIGRRLTTSETFARELDAYDATVRRCYRFQLLASANLRLSDVRNDCVRAYDLLDTVALHATNQGSKMTIGSPLSASSPFGLSNGHSFEATSADEHDEPLLLCQQHALNKPCRENLLPLFGHLCCRIQVMPKCIDRIQLSGYLRTAMVSATPLLSNGSRGAGSPMVPGPNSASSANFDVKDNSDSQTLGRKLARALNSAELYWATLRNFAILLWPIDEKLRSVVLCRDNNNDAQQSQDPKWFEHLEGALGEPAMVVPANRHTRILRASNSTLTLDTQNGCYTLSAHHGLADYAGAVSQAANWLRAIEQQISDNRAWAPVLDQILKPVAQLDSNSSPLLQTATASVVTDRSLATNDRCKSTSWSRQAPHSLTSSSCTSSLSTSQSRSTNNSSQNNERITSDNYVNRGVSASKIDTHQARIKQASVTSVARHQSLANNVNTRLCSSNVPTGHKPASKTHLNGTNAISSKQQRVKTGSSLASSLSSASSLTSSTSSSSSSSYNRQQFQVPNDARRAAKITDAQRNPMLGNQVKDPTVTQL